MRPGGRVCIILLSLILIAGCIRFPGNVISDTPDPIVGQWIGGEPPEIDMHVVFYENRTFFSLIVFLSRGKATDTGTWTKIERGQYSTRSVTGEITNWTYEPWDDSVYVSKLPQRKYYRYKG